MLLKWNANEISRKTMRIAKNEMNSVRRRQIKIIEWMNGEWMNEIKKKAAEVNLKWMNNEFWIDFSLAS